MHHSHLLINVGDNPDRPDWNITRRWLRNLYRVHQRLCMAFPSKTPASSADRVAAFCTPFDGARVNHLCELPGEPDTAEVHHVRGGTAGFLYRIDYPVDQKRGVRRPIIIVQSANKPDWPNAFGLDERATDERGRPIGNAGFLLAAPPQTKEVSIDCESNTLALVCADRPAQKCEIKPGDLVRFRLRVNPTRKIEDGSPNGKRKRIRPELGDHADWLAGKLAGAAASPICIETFVPGWAYGWRSKYEPQPSQRMQWWSVLFEGVFRLGDVRELKSLLESGIGPAKAFGFGLLSVARVKP
ncbi:MAG: type I-E CRISPR-associated protein Cas6/Cse3/CasE [Thermoguttaceae bacterium]